MRVMLRQNRLVAMLCGAAVLLGAVPMTPAGQDMEGLVEAALDQKITTPIAITDRPIREALRELEKPTGLTFAIDPAALEWMPYGPETRITIHLDQISVREGLQRVFDGLGLTLFVVDGKVRVEPAPWLARLGRRLTLDEVGTLKKLSQSRWPKLGQPGGVAIARMPQEAGSAATLTQELARHPGPNGLAQLEAISQKLACFWVPDGAGITLYSFSEDIEQRLDLPLDVHYSRVPLDQMLLDLGSRCGITFRFETGTLNKIDADERKVDLVQRRITARQILELLVGRIEHLWYDVVDDGVVLGWKQRDDSSTRRRTKPRVAAILRFPVGEDGTTVDVLIWEDQVPPEYQDVLATIRERKVPQVFEMLREKLGE